MELTCHDGTVRDLIFIESSINRSTILVSGGAGNCHLNITDCNTGQLVQSMKGHSGKCALLTICDWVFFNYFFVNFDQLQTCFWHCNKFKKIYFEVRKIFFRLESALYWQFELINFQRFFSELENFFINFDRLQNCLWHYDLFEIFFLKLEIFFSIRKCALVRIWDW